MRIHSLLSLHVIVLNWYIECIAKRLVRGQGPKTHRIIIICSECSVGIIIIPGSMSGVNMELALEFLMNTPSLRLSLASSMTFSLLAFYKRMKYFLMMTRTTM